MSDMLPEIGVTFHRLTNVCGKAGSGKGFFCKCCDDVNLGDVHLGKERRVNLGKERRDV